MKPLAIARLELKRVFRLRANIFFLFVFPLALILILGAAFGGSFTPKVGLLSAGGGPLERELRSAFAKADAFDVESGTDEAELLTRVERGRLQGAVVIPPGYDAALRSGAVVKIRYIARADQMELRTTVEAIAARQAASVRAARFAAAESGVPFDEAVRRARAAAAALDPIDVRVESVGEAVFPEDLGRFDVGAPSELILFVFLMSLMGGIALIESRRLGVIRRMFSTPTSSRDIILGEGLGRFAMALVQGIAIMIGSLLLFGVAWGDPLGAAALLVVFSLVGAGAGMLIGSVLRTEQQAVATSLLIGLGLGALGGCMVPAEFFSEGMRTVAHFTPHAWALDAFSDLIRRGEGLKDIGPQLATLLGYAAVFLGIASWRLRRVLTR